MSKSTRMHERHQIEYPLIICYIIWICYFTSSVLTAPTSWCPLSPPENVHFDFEGPVHWVDKGFKLSVICADKYNSSKAIIVCQENGTWSKPNPPCEHNIKGVLCDFPGIPDNGQLHLPCSTLNCVISFTCNEGYWYNGTMMRTCQRNETWSGAPGKCEAVQCPVLPDPPNGCIEQANRSYLGQAEVKCEEGYIYSKPNETVRRCLGDNTWSGGEVATCEEAPCPNIDEVDNGILSPTTGRYKDTVTLQCQSGYTLDGPFHVTCMAEGTWSTPLGKCLLSQSQHGTFPNVSPIPWIVPLLLILILANVIVLLHLRRKRRREGPEDHPNSNGIPLLNLHRPPETDSTNC